MFSTLRSTQDQHWIISISLIVLILLVIVKWNKNNYFFSFLNSLVSLSFYTKKFAEKRRIELPEIFLFVASLLGISFFLFVIFKQERFSILVYLQILFLITIIILSKYLVEKIVGDLFEIDQLLGRYLFYKQGIMSWLGLFFLFPLGLFLYYNQDVSPMFAVLIAGVSILIYVVKLFTFVRVYQKYILTYWFYFILYLCAFEIAPYLILFKVVEIN